MESTISQISATFKSSWKVIKSLEGFQENQQVREEQERARVWDNFSQNPYVCGVKASSRFIKLQYVEAQKVYVKAISG